MDRRDFLKLSGIALAATGLAVPVVAGPINKPLAVTSLEVFDLNRFSRIHLFIINIGDGGRPSTITVSGTLNDGTICDLVLPYTPANVIAVQDRFRNC